VRQQRLSGGRAHCGLGSVWGRKKKQRNQKRPSRNVVDTTLVWGDCMTLVATQLVRITCRPENLFSKSA